MRYLCGKLMWWLLAALAILFLPSIASATPSEQWNRTFGGLNNDSGWSAQQTSDGGYILTGWTESFGAGGSDVYLVKTDSVGNFQWSKTFGGAGRDGAYSVQQTSDGGYILAGDTSSYGNGSGDVYLVKTDSSGSQQWYKTFGGIYFDSAHAVQQTVDGGYILTGQTGVGYSGDAWLIKTDANGNEEWNRIFGGANDDATHAVQQTSDGGYILAGRTYGANPDTYLIKTDASGYQQWSKTFAGPYFDEGISVRQTLDGGYIIAGETGSITYGSGGDAFLIKTDASGNQEWYKTFGGIASDRSLSVQQTSDSGYILAGATGVDSFWTVGDAWLIKTDSNGDEMWNRTFGGINREEAWSVQQTSDGAYILAGYTNSYGAGGDDAWLIKISGDVSASMLHYTATVTTTQQNTFIQDVNGSFGSIRVGQSRVISNSVILNNTGDANATVDARFINNLNETYGFISGSNVLNATNFAFGAASTGSWTPLHNNGSNARVVTVPFGAIIALDARLDIPVTQPPGDYSGIVVLTFGNEVQ